MAPTRKQGLNAQDAALVARLALEGRTSAEIAAEVGNDGDGRPKISPSGVLKRLKADERRYLAQAAEHIAKRHARHLAQVEYSLARAWRSFNLSCRASVEVKDPVTGEPLQVQIETPGDPRFLQVIAVFTDRRAKLLGTDAAPKAPDLSIPDPARGAEGEEMTLSRADAVLSALGTDLLALGAAAQGELAAVRRARKVAELGEDE